MLNRRPDGDCRMIGEAGAPGQDTWVRFHLLVADDVVKDARFQAYGCPHTLAVAAWMANGAAGPDAAMSLQPGTPAEWARTTASRSRNSVGCWWSKMRYRHVFGIGRDGRRMVPPQLDIPETMAISLTESAANRVKTFLLPGAMASACDWACARPGAPDSPTWSITPTKLTPAT